MKQIATACQYNLPRIQFLSSILLDMEEKEVITAMKRDNIVFWGQRGNSNLLANRLLKAWCDQRDAPEQNQGTIAWFSNVIHTEVNMRLKKMHY